MDDAARRGFLEVVKFLHFNRTEGCTWAVMSGAARRGSLAIIQFLCEQRPEGGVLDALREAAVLNRLEVFAYLYERPGSQEAVYRIIHCEVGWELNPRIVKFLQKHEQVSFLSQAVAKKCSRFVHFIVAHAIASRAELEEAKALAATLELPKFEMFLTKAIRWHGHSFMSTSDYYSAFW